jgi:hypothetical protein
VRFFFIFFAFLVSCDSSPKKPSDVVTNAVKEVCKKKDYSALHSYYHPDEAALIKTGAAMMSGFSKAIENAMSPADKAAYKKAQFSFCEKPITILSEKVEGTRALVVASDKSKYFLQQLKGKWYLTTVR